MIHTYSLIHDDLPSMDDDDLRRGKPTNHKVFGEAVAILAGDALLTHAFQMIAETPDEFADSTVKVELIRNLAEAAGPEGMVGGQTADISGEGKSLTLEELKYIHVHKTGKMLTYSVLAGAILAGAPERTKKLLEKFSYHLGLAFQIRDDILDLEGQEDVTRQEGGQRCSQTKKHLSFVIDFGRSQKSIDRESRVGKKIFVPNRPRNGPLGGNYRFGRKEELLILPLNEIVRPSSLWYNMLG